MFFFFTFRSNLEHFGSSKSYVDIKINRGSAPLLRSAEKREESKEFSASVFRSAEEAGE